MTYFVRTPTVNCCFVGSFDEFRVVVFSITKILRKKYHILIYVGTKGNVNTINQFANYSVNMILSKFTTNLHLSNKQGGWNKREEWVIFFAY